MVTTEITMGIGDRSAFPEHLDTKEEVEAAFPDDSQYKGFFGNLWKRWNKATKHWDAFGPRSPKGIAFSMWPPFIVARKWRKCPTVIFAIKGQGPWRIESLDGMDTSIEFPDRKFLFFPRIESSAASTMTTFYLTRVQYWTRWHFALQWPLFISFHRYKSQADVIPAGERGNRKGRLWMGYLGAKFDADWIFWWIAANFANTFK